MKDPKMMARGQDRAPFAQARRKPAEQKAAEKKLLADAGNDSQQQERQRHGHGGQFADQLAVEFLQKPGSGEKSLLQIDQLARECPSGEADEQGGGDRLRLRASISRKVRTRSILK